jgi:YVTN family beta-propeller protein
MKYYHPAEAANLGPAASAIRWTVREIQYQLLGLAPLVKPNQLPSFGTQAIVVGTLNTVGPFGNPVEFSVTGRPTQGTVSVGADGFYAYTPGEALAAIGGTDVFTVTATDTAFHLENLFGVPGRRTTVTVPVTVTVAQSPPGSADTVQFTVVNTSVVEQEFDGLGSTHASLSPAPGTVLDSPTSQAVLDAGDLGLTQTRFEISGGTTVAYFNPVGVIHEGVTQTIISALLDYPSAVAVSPDGTRAYVSNTGYALSVIDTATYDVVGNISTGDTYPAAIAISPDGTRVYVAGSLGSVGAVTVIDAATNQVTATVDLASYALDVAVSPDGKHLYVANSDLDQNNSVSVVDTATYEVTATIGFGSDVAVTNVAVSPDGTHVYATYLGFDGSGYSVKVIDTTTNTITATIGYTDPQCPVPVAITVSPDGQRVYAVYSQSVLIDLPNENPVKGNVSVIDTATNTVINTIAVNPGSGVAVSPDGANLYVAGFLTGSVSVIDTTANVVTGSYRVGSDPLGVAVTPDGTHAYVTNSASNSISVSGMAPVGTHGDGGTAQYTVTMAGSTASCAAKGSSQCNTAGTTVYLLDPTGTVATVPADEAQQQSDVLQVVVKDDGSNATFYTKYQPSIGYSDPLKAQGFSPYTNNTLDNSTNTYTVSTTTSQTSSVQYNVSVKVTEEAKFSLLSVKAEEGAQITWGTTTTATQTYTQATTQTVRPGYTLYLYTETPVLRFYGDWSVVYGNTSYYLTDVWYNTPYTVTTGYPAYLAAYTCQAGSDDCAQLAAGQIPASYANAWPSAPTYPVAESDPASAEPARRSGGARRSDARRPPRRCSRPHRHGTECSRCASR